jgi:hypothetical protein
MMSDDHDLRRLLVHLIDEIRAPRLSLLLVDVRFLVDIALQHEEITMSRAAELLGLSVVEMRARAKAVLDCQKVDDE